MDPVRRVGPPVVAKVTTYEVVQLKPPGTREGALEPEFDLLPRSFYVDSSDIGRPMWAARMDYVQAVQKLVFG